MSSANSPFRILSVGEVLWDLLPSGRVLGGAPANFAFHARALGADARLASRVGRDALGDEIAERLREHGLPLDTLQRDDEAPTGTVDVALDAAGQPQFTICENAAWDRLTLEDAALAAARSADAICFGSLAQRSATSRRTIRELVSGEALRVFDVNLRAPFFSREVIEPSLQLANLLKLNDAELPILAEMFGLPSGGEEAMLAGLAERFSLYLIACTRGGRGSVLWSRAQVSEHPGVPTEVCDTIGAGDAFTAAMTLGLLAGWPLDEINQRANEIAAFVCSQPGATPALPDSLRAPFQRSAL